MLYIITSAVHDFIRVSFTARAAVRAAPYNTLREPLQLAAKNEQEGYSALWWIPQGQEPVDPGKPITAGLDGRPRKNKPVTIKRVTPKQASEFLLGACPEEIDVEDLPEIAKWRLPIYNISGWVARACPLMIELLEAPWLVPERLPSAEELGISA